MEGARVRGQGVGFRGGRFWQLAILAAAGTIGFTPQAKAYLYYWDDSAPVVIRQAPQAQEPHAKGSHRGEKKSRAVVEKESKPQGPLIISISIAQQKLRLYDANGLYAESPISTGMPGHPTPMGVFSIIQKQKFHKSNIYSGAPMPFMQRITWSGVAMHAGVLPGYPASHGCIRMPMAFAIKMYGWTRMGARVIVTPGDVTPASFSHPLLAQLKVAPPPVTMQETKTDTAEVRAPEKPVQGEPSTPAGVTEAKFDLRSTVGHVEPIKTATEDSPPSATLKTADASGAVPATLVTDRATGAVPSDPAQPAAVATASDHQAPKAAAETNAPKPALDSTSAKRDETVSPDARPDAGKAGDVQPAKIADADAKPSGGADALSSEPEAPPAKNATKLNDAQATSAVSPPSTEAPKSDVAAEAPNPKPSESTPAVAATPPSAPPANQAAPPAATAETPLKDDLKSDITKADAPKPDAGFAFQGTGQIAVFVSRKDSKLYIRQNFAPLFQIPVTIAADTRPLGTHIFTAQVDSHDANVLHWSVVSLPALSKSAERRAEERSSRGHRFAARAETKPVPVPDTPTEALDRISLPPEVMAKIYEAVSTGGSIIVSDQGIAAGETGEGTDFIVSLR